MAHNKFYFSLLAYLRVGDLAYYSEIDREVKKPTTFIS